MNQDVQRSLEDLLDREIELAHSLAKILDAEKTALTGESAATVEKMAGEKIRLFDTMEKLEQERLSLCENPGVAGIAQTVAARWRSLIGLMARCRAANEV